MLVVDLDLLSVKLLLMEKKVKNQEVVAESVLDLKVDKTQFTEDYQKEDLLIFIELNMLQSMSVI